MLNLNQSTYQDNMLHSFLVTFLSFHQGMVMLFRMVTKDANFVMISGYESGSIMIWNIKHEIAIDAKTLYENPGNMIVSLLKETTPHHMREC